MKKLHFCYLLFFWLVILCLICSSCRPSTSGLPPQFNQFATSSITYTPTLTPIPSPTITSTPTVTSTPTLVATSSPIPTLEANWLTLPAPTISIKNIDRIQYQTHLGLVGFTAWSPNNKFVAVANGQRIALYNFKSLTEISLQPDESETAKEVKKQVRFTAIAFSPDSTILVAAYETVLGGGFIVGAGIWIWQTNDGKLLHSSSGGDGGWATSLAFSPDGTTLALGEDTDIVLFDMQQLKPTRSWTAHTWILDGLAFSPDGKVLATVSRDNRFDLWNVSDGSKIFESFGTKDDPNLIAGLEAVTFSPSGDYVAIGSTYGFIRLYQIDDEDNIKEIKDWKVDQPGSINLAFSPDETMLVSSSYSGVEFWSLPGCISLKKLKETGGTLKFSSDGTLLMIGYQFWTVK